MTTEAKRHLAIRISEPDLALIDELAKRHCMTRTDYIVRACTGELEDPLELQAQFDSIDERLSRLETGMFG
jgi:uncharacterized protein (DUF1778 family)